MQADMVTEGSGPVQQLGGYGLFVGRLVERVGAQVEVSVREFAVNIMAQ
jgi:hypothetical protein